MSTSLEPVYGGLPKLAIRFWRDMAAAFLLIGLTATSLGGLIFAVVVLLAPDVALFTLFALTGLVLAFSGHIVRSVWTGEISVTKMQEANESLNGIQTFILWALESVYTGGVVLFATALCAALVTIGVVDNVTILATIASLTAIADLGLVRRTGWSPGGVGVRMVLRLIHIAGLLNDMSINQIPFVGGRQRGGLV